MSSFSSDIQTPIKHLFPLNFLYELLMSLRTDDETLRLILDILLQDMMLFFWRSETGLECTEVFFSKVVRHPFV